MHYIIFYFMILFRIPFFPLSHNVNTGPATQNDDKLRSRLKFNRGPRTISQKNVSDVCVYRTHR